MERCGQYLAHAPLAIEHMGNSQPVAKLAALCQCFSVCKRTEASTVGRFQSSQKRLRPLILRRRLTAPSPKISDGSPKRLFDKNSVDTLGTLQQMISRLTSFLKTGSKDQHPEDNNGDGNGESSSTSDSFEATGTTAHNNKSGYDSSETPLK